MNWLKLFLDWQIIGERESMKRSHRKREVLLRIAAPVMKGIEELDIIEHWDHSFQGPKGALSHGTISILISTKEKPEIVKRELRDRLNEFEEQEHFDFDVGAPSQMIEFWGEQNSEKFAKLRELSSQFVLEAMKGEVRESRGLGKSRTWHAKENRLGHVWLNQLGFGILHEALLSQRNAMLRLNQVRNQFDSNFDEIISRQKEILQELAQKTGQQWIIQDLIQDSDEDSAE